MSQLNIFYRGNEPDPIAALDHWLASPPDLIGVDTETVSLKDRTIIGIGIAFTPTEAYYFYALPLQSVYWDAAITLLENPNIIKVYHNAMFDLNTMRHLDIDGRNSADTMLMAKIMAMEGQLGALAWQVGRQVQDAGTMMKLAGVTSMLDLGMVEVGKKCCEDAGATLALYPYLKQKLYEAGLWDYYKREEALIPELLRMGAHPIKLDLPMLREIDKSVQVDIDALLHICQTFDFHPGSWQQVAVALMKRGHALPMRRRRGKPAVPITDRKVLEQLPKQDMLIDLVLLYRNYVGLKSRYTTPLLEHDTFTSAYRFDLATGRLASGKGAASTDRNIQNIFTPGKRPDTEGMPAIRAAFMPDSDVWTRLDYNQIEMRFMAELSLDPVMMRIYHEGGDIHDETERALWGTSGPRRRLAKVFNFLVIYLGDEYVARAQTKLPLDVCRDTIARWFQRYEHILPWIEEQYIFGINHGYVETMQGRRMKLPEDESIAEIRRKCANYPVQGSAADAVKQAMYRLAGFDREYTLEPLLPRIQVHDELDFDGDVRDKLPAFDLAHVSPIHTPYSNPEIIERWK